MKIEIILTTPPKEKSKYPTREKARGSIEERVKEALDKIDSGKDSHVEWAMINRLYAALQKKDRTPRVDNLLKKIEPIMSKYGQHGVAAKDR